MQTNINQFKLPIGNTTQERDKWNRLIPLMEEIQDVDIKKVEIYNLPAERHRYRAGSAARLVIFANGTSMDAPAGTRKIDIPSIGEVDMLAQCPNAVGIEWNGVIVAHYLEKYNEVSILFDIFASFSDVKLELFKVIVEVVNRATQGKYDKYNWNKTPDRPAFLEGVKSYLVSVADQNAKKSRDKVAKLEEELANIRNTMANSIRALTSQRRFMDMDESTLNEMGSKIVQQLELIVTHPKVTNILFMDNKFVVHTERLAINHDGKLYDAGSFKIEIQPESTTVRFLGDNPRQGYWGANCPHPHVNESGNACLGNAQPVIAELCAQTELFPLVDYCITFLESVNVEDVAGKAIKNWDVITPKKPEKVEVVTPDVVVASVEVAATSDEENCDLCGDTHATSDLYEVYTTHDRGEAPDQVCEHCRAVHYTWRESYNRFIRD